METTKIISGYAKNDLRYTETKTKGRTRITVRIRLNDECKNGHQDFSITCDGYEKADNGRWYESFGGCCHEEILKLWPQFKPFVDLHLSDRKGVPMYVVGNGYYWLKERLCNPEKAYIFKEYMRLTDDEVKKFEHCDDEEYFRYLLYHLGIVARWEQEAQQAIRQLETLIGNNIRFYDDSVKDNITPLPLEKIAEIEKRIAEGYYAPEKIEERRLAAIEAKKQKRIEELKAHTAAKIRKEKENLQIHLYVLNAGLSDDNFIYYDHTKQGVFNWCEGTYRSRITQEQFDDFISKVDYSQLPSGIQFSIKL